LISNVQVPGKMNKNKYKFRYCPRNLRTPDKTIFYKVGKKDILGGGKKNYLKYQDFLVAERNQKTIK